MANLMRIAVMAFVTFGVSHASAINLSLNDGLFNQETSSGVIKVQTGDPSVRIGQLEEQIRALTGRLEDLGFQMLQMQEQMRQMQQDNEFRFQDLEKAKSNDQSNLVPKTSRPNPDGDVQVAIGNAKFDADGNLINDASLAAGGASGELYKTGYGYILSGDYAQAEQVFQSYIDQYPNEAQAADAHFWLGEAKYSQGRYKEAARTFLDAHKIFPNENKSPDTLLKLGMALYELDNRETACATYQEVLTRYPSSSKAVKDKVASEQSRAQC